MNKRSITEILSGSNLKITLGPRPGKKSFSKLQELEITHCATLLSEREDAHAIAKICKKLGQEGTHCEWVWLPLEGGKLEILRQSDIPLLINTLVSAIEDTVDPHVYLHCSAGIHRTGFFTYILLRLLGHDEQAAVTELANLREVTSNQVGDERIELAESFVASML